MRCVSRRHQHRLRSPVALLVELAQLRHGDRVERRLRAHRRMPVGMRTVQPRREHALGQRRGHVAQLHQAAQTQRPHAAHVFRIEPRRRHDFREQLQRGTRELRQRHQADHRRIRADLGVEDAADAREALVDGEGIGRAAAFVEHVGGEGGEPGTIGGIGRDTDRQQQHEADHRQLAMLHRPQPQRRVGVAMFGDARKVNAGIGSERRKLAAIQRHQLTTALVESGSASEVCSSGTTLNATRCAGTSRRAASRTSSIERRR